MTAHDDRARDEQPASTAREIPADELAEAEHAFRIAVPDSFGVDAVPDWAVQLYMAEYDERGRERDAARAEVERLRDELDEERFRVDRQTMRLRATAAAIQRARKVLREQHTVRVGLDRSRWIRVGVVEGALDGDTTEEA